MGGNTGPRLKHTTVNLYEEDVEVLQQNGIAVSDGLRELVHYLCEHDMTDVLKSVRYGQLFAQLNELQSKMERARAERDHLNSVIDEYSSNIAYIMECQAKFKLYEDNQDKIDRICLIGKSIDNLMYVCNFDVEAMRRANIPELKEMEEINPGWNLDEHVRMRKSIGNGSCISIQ